MGELYVTHLTIAFILFLLVGVYHGRSAGRTARFSYLTGVTSPAGVINVSSLVSPDPLLVPVPETHFPFVPGSAMDTEASYKNRYLFSDCEVAISFNETELNVTVQTNHSMNIDTNETVLCGIHAGSDTRMILLTWNTTDEALFNDSNGIVKVTGDCDLLDACFVARYIVVDYGSAWLFNHQFRSPNTSLVYYSNEVIKIKANITSITGKGGIPEYHWRMFSVNNSEVNVLPLSDINIFQPGTYELSIPPNSLDEGQYIVFIEVQNYESYNQSQAYGHYVMEDFVYIRITLPDLVALIKGQSVYQIPNSNYIDAAASHDPAASLPSMTSLPVKTSWTVVGCNDTGAIDECLVNFPECALFSSGVLTTEYHTTENRYYLMFDTSRFVYDTSVLVIFTMKRGDRLSSALQVIEIVSTRYFMSYSCIYNCYTNTVNKISKVRLEFELYLNANKNHFSISYERLVQEWDIGMEAFVASDVTFETGLMSNSVSITKGTLKEGKTYKFNVTAVVQHHTVKEELNMVLVRHINYVPYGGYCVISNRTGVAALDIFVVTCDGWKDEEERLERNIVADDGRRLTYVVVQRVRGGDEQTLVVADAPLFGALFLSFVLKLGDTYNLYETEVVVKVIDMFDDAAEVPFNVSSTPAFAFNSITADNAGASVVYDFMERVNETLYLGDIDLDVAICPAAADHLNAIPIPVQETQLDKTIDEVPGVILDININKKDNNQTSFQELMNSLLNPTIDPATIAIQLTIQFCADQLYNVFIERSVELQTNAKYLNMVTQAFNRLILVPEYVNSQTEVKVIAALSSLSATSTTIWSAGVSTGTREKTVAESQLVDLTGNTINVVVPSNLNQARVVYDMDMARGQIDDMVVISGQNMTDAVQKAGVSPSERAYLYLKGQEQLNKELNGAMNKAKQTAHSILEVTQNVLETTELCENCSITLGSGDVVQTVTLMESNKLANTTLSTGSASVKLDSISRISTDNVTLLTVSKTHFEKNVFMYDSDRTSSLVAYGVVHVQFDSQIESIDDVTFEQAVDDVYPEVIYPYIDDDDVSQFSLHKFIYRTSMDNVCLKLKPLDDMETQYTVYVHFNNPPTILEYKIKFTINSNDDWMHYITADQMNGHTGMTYLGVQIGSRNVEQLASVLSETTSSTIPAASVPTTSTTTNVPTTSDSYGRRKRDANSVKVTETNIVKNSSDTDILFSDSLKLRQSSVSVAYKNYIARRKRRAATVDLQLSNNTSKHPPYMFSLVTSACLNWDESKKTWSNNKCKLEWFPDLQKVRCRCQNIPQMTFGTSFFVAPNTIDFSSAFLRFSPQEQAAVIATICVVFTVYIISAILARRQDQKDILQWGVLPLTDNIETDTCCYVVQVHTGFRIGSGTKSRVMIVLSGDKRDTGIRDLHDGVRHKFATGSVMQFMLTTYGHLGQLTHLRIWHDNSGQGDWASWYLSKVDIHDMKQNHTYTFLKEDWIAVENCKDCLECTLTAAQTQTLHTFDRKFSSHAKDRFSESHLLASLFYRPTFSNFTRVQRVTCVLVYVMVNMIANAMYFNPGEEYETAAALQVGPLRFSLMQFYVSIVTALITTPFTLIVGLIFKFSKRRVTLDRLSSQTGNQSQTGMASMCCCGPKHTERKREEDSSVMFIKQDSGPCLLPGYFAIFGWILAVGGVITSAFFVLLYSMEWGKQKSEEWLTTFVLSLLESVTLIDPVMILLIAFFLAMVTTTLKHSSLKQWQKDSGVKGNTHTISSVWPDDKPSSSAPLEATELEEAQRRRHTERRLNKTVVDFIFNIIFVWIVFSISYSNRDGNSFYLHRDVVNRVTRNESGSDVFSSISTVREYFTWLKGTAIPALFPESYINGEGLHWTMRDYMTGLQAYRLGPPRLRQFRIKSELCKLPMVDTVDCYKAYSADREEDGEFCLGWNNPPCSAWLSNYSESAWTYSRKQSLEVALPTLGRVSSYGVNGYVADLDINRNFSIEIINELFEYVWVDRKTRAILLEFTLYCANVNLFVYSQFLTEFMSTGGTFTSFSVLPSRVYQHVGSFGTYIFVCEILGAIYMIFLGIRIGFVVFNEKCHAFKKFWIRVDLMQFVLCIGTVVVYFIRHRYTLATIEAFEKDQRSFVDFHLVTFWDQVVISLLGTSVFLATIRALKILEGNKTIYMISAVFSKMASYLLWLGALFIYIMVVFSLLGYLLFGSRLMPYMNVYSSISTLFMTLIGKNRYSEMNETNPILAKVYFFTYVVITSFILFSVILSTLLTCINDVARNAKVMKSNDVFEYAIQRLILKIKSKTSANKYFGDPNKVISFDDKF